MGVVGPHCGGGGWSRRNSQTGGIGVAGAVQQSGSQGPAHDRAAPASSADNDPIRQRLMAVPRNGCATIASALGCIGHTARGSVLEIAEGGADYRKK
jgi:hypothetical protein